MNLLLAAFLLSLAVIPSVLLGLLAVECLLALLPARQARRGPRISVAVLMPAHNEETVIAQALTTVIPQLIEGDRILVVADNCSDKTAQIARAAGANVLERVHETDRGKGFALAAGIEVFEKAAAEGQAELPEVLVILDADSELLPGGLESLSCTVSGTGRAAQALNLMYSPPGSSASSLMSMFAVLVKNHVRPRGLDRLGLPVPLTGSGMAFPWAQISKYSLANDDIVEDMRLGAEMMCDGNGACFLETARVQSRLSSSDSASISQRVRWEHGHLQTIVRFVPQFFGKAFARARPGLLLLGLDLAVPPLSLLVMASVILEVMLIAVVLGTGFASGYWYAGLVAAPVLLASTLALAGVALLLVWWRFAKAIIPVKALVSIPAYTLGKIPIYLKYLVQRQTEWIRTDRE